MTIDIDEQYDKIYRYCYYKLKNPTLAEDTTQETFLHYLECGSYREVGRPLAYLYTIARNLCIDQFRKKTFTELTEDMAIHEDEEQKIVSMDLRIAVEELNERERELVLLRYVNEVPVSVISKMFNISRFALYRELKQILGKLEGRISDESKKETRTGFSI